MIGNGTSTVYVDGVAVGMAGSLPSPQSLGDLDYAYIGKSQFGVDPYLDAQIDEFRVYDRALSASEVKALYAYAGS